MWVGAVARAQAQHRVDGHPPMAKGSEPSPDARVEQTESGGGYREPSPMCLVALGLVVTTLAHAILAFVALGVYATCVLGPGGHGQDATARTREIRKNMTLGNAPVPLEVASVMGRM